MNRLHPRPGVVTGNVALTGKILLAGLALFAGGAIYIFLRSSDPLFFQWVEHMGMGGSFTWLRNTGWLSETDVPSWFRYALPDALWAFAYALLISSIWSGSHSPIRYFWLASIPVLILGFEFAQLAGLLPGTFCPVDLTFSVTGLILGIYLGILNPNAPENEEIHI